MNRDPYFQGDDGRCCEHPFSDVKIDSINDQFAFHFGIGAAD
jgi:hypothetical protein